MVFFFFLAFLFWVYLCLCVSVLFFMVKRLCTFKSIEGTSGVLHSKLSERLKIVIHRHFSPLSVSTSPLCGKRRDHTGEIRKGLTIGESRAKGELHCTFPESSSPSPSNQNLCTLRCRWRAN